VSGAGHALFQTGVSRGEIRRKRAHRHTYYVEHMFLTIRAEPAYCTDRSSEGRKGLDQQYEINTTGRNERGGLDVVEFAWDRSQAKMGKSGPSNFLPEIERQLAGHDWVTDLPAKVSVGDNPDEKWTIFLLPGCPLPIWIDNEKAFWVDYLIYLVDMYLNGEKENYLADTSWVEEACYYGA